MTTTTEQATFIRLFGDATEKAHLKEHGTPYICSHCNRAHSPMVTPTMCATIERGRDFDRTHAPLPPLHNC